MSLIAESLILLLYLPVNFDNRGFYFNIISFFLLLLDSCVCILKALRATASRFLLSIALISQATNVSQVVAVTHSMWAVKPTSTASDASPARLFSWSFAPLAVFLFLPPSDPSRWESHSPLQRISPWPHYPGSDSVWLVVSPLEPEPELERPCCSRAPIILSAESNWTKKEHKTGDGMGARTVTLSRYITACDSQRYLWSL